MIFALNGLRAIISWLSYIDYRCFKRGSLEPLHGNLGYGQLFHGKSGSNFSLVGPLVNTLFQDVVCLAILICNESGPLLSHKAIILLFTVHNLPAEYKYNDEEKEGNALLELLNILTRRILYLAKSHCKMNLKLLLVALMKSVNSKKKSMKSKLCRKKCRILLMTHAPVKFFCPHRPPPPVAATGSEEKCV